MSKITLVHEQEKIILITDGTSDSKESFLIMLEDDTAGISISLSPDAAKELEEALGHLLGYC